MKKKYYEAKDTIGNEISNQWAARPLQLSRQNEKILVGLITEQAGVNYNRYKTRKVDSPYCRFRGLEDLRDGLH